MRLGVAVIWLLHFLPLPILARIGTATGTLLYLLVRRRRRVVLTNLALCFPALPVAEHRALARRHFQAFARSVLERGICWWSSKARIHKLVRIEGLTHWR